MNNSDQRIRTLLSSQPRLRLFLDYDGTLADFRDHPDQVEPLAEVIDLLKFLRNSGKIRLAVLSGRRLAHLQTLIPVNGITLAGTYGLEILKADGSLHYRLDYNRVRPALEMLKPIWIELIKDKQGFFLEDKGWSLALHARFAEDAIAADLLKKAQEQAAETLDIKEFRVLPGHRFLEAGPLLADKGEGMKYLLEIDPPEEESLLYLGDDDKDEAAFRVVQSCGGAAIRVCSNVINQAIEDWRLPNPQETRLWLRSLPGQLT